MNVQRLIAGIVLGIVLSPVLSDEADEVEAFKTAYAAYQEHEKSQNYKLAMPEAKAAYEIGKRLYGKEHANTAALAYNYGLALVEVGDEGEAKIILREAVTLHENVYGKDSVELIPLLMDLGGASAKISRPEKQKKYYDHALKLARNHYGPDSVAYGNLLLVVGAEILNRTHSSSARSYLQDAYQILRDALGNKDIATGVAAFQLARVEVASKQYGKAERHLLAALNTFEDPDRPSTTIEMGTHAWLVSVYEELGEPEKATAHCQAIGRMTPMNEDQEYLPLFRKAPRYPTVAQQRGSEGYVDVEFTVDHEGIVRDPKVIKVKGHNSFVDRSIEAVEGFRYAPRFVDGYPVSTPGVRTRLTYKFSD